MEAKVGMATSALMAKGTQAKYMGFHPKPSHWMCVHNDRETNNHLWNGHMVWETGLKPSKRTSTKFRNSNTFA